MSVKSKKKLLSKVQNTLDNKLKPTVKPTVKATVKQIKVIPRKFGVPGHNNNF